MMLLQLQQCLIILLYLLYGLIINVFGELYGDGILYPKQTETRELQSLDGLWNFVVPSSEDSLIGHKQKWYLTDLNKLSNQKVHLMPVPSSYNDITVDAKIRDHLGPVWYDRRFYLPQAWSNNNQRIWLRFGSVSYAAQVYLNGNQIGQHDIGHLPFLMEITNYVYFNTSNLLTVMCDNTLLQDTIPQGRVIKLITDPLSFRDRLIQTYRFDFFNYAGIDRSVHLYTTPNVYIDDISITTQFENVNNNNVGILEYRIDYINPKNLDTTLELTLYDNNQEKVLNVDNNYKIINNQVCNGTLKVPNVNLWWPYLMDWYPGYMYTLKIDLFEIQSSIKILLDTYHLRIGFRTIQWTDEQVLINNRRLYLYGLGKHEDSEIRGRGFDLPTVLRDFNLIKWLGANSFRTSHYPYSEEIMDLADQFGIMVIDECPSVNTDIFSKQLLKNHKRSLKSLIRRDKNHPSVIMWSAANEPATSRPGSTEYFYEIIKYMKELDETRPITIVESTTNIAIVNSSKYVDVISFNQYHGWYTNPGNLDAIPYNVIEVITQWHKKFKKPIIQQEYGADTMEGLHLLPAYVWSEEYQINLMSQHFEAFDRLREEGWFVGEFIWNFADFKTDQSYTRVGGNKKGIFTRNRQPKSSAFHLRRRYWHLSERIYNITALPVDLYDYIISESQYQ